MYSIQCGGEKKVIYIMKRYYTTTVQSERERKMKEALKKQFQNMRFPLLVAILIWLKTYIVTRTSFDLKLESAMQEWILFISPLASSLLLVGLALFAKGQKRNYIAIVINLIMTIILIGNVMFLLHFQY